MLEGVLIHGRSADASAELATAFRDQLSEHCRVECVDDAEVLLQAVRDRGVSHLVILSDGDAMEDATYLALIPRLREACRDVPIVVVAEQGNVASAARAIEAGATDFLVRGEQLSRRIETLLGKLRGLLEVIERNRLLDERNLNLQQRVEAHFSIAGQSRQIRNLIAKIERIGNVPRPVLIVGERGTGKELVARAIHEAGDRRTAAMITVNCAAVSETLLESELFGHEKGAFTGADETRRGKFEQADGGTLFLDEIGNMLLAFQQKILRVVEYGTFQRVGGTREMKTTVRIIAATNCELKERIKAGAFLADLYDRLSFEIIGVPALRDRKGDIAVLAQHFLDQFAEEIPAFKGKVLSQAAIDMLNQYTFPGNVRELKNIIERAAYRDTTNEITPEDIGMLASEEITVGQGTFKEKVDTFSTRLLQDALEKARGNQARAARRLGLSYHQFRYYHGKYLRPDSSE